MESPTTRRDDASQPCEDRPLVSVVVPFYNVEECVADCMGSLVHQDFDGYEVVCIDDGSTDGTGALLDAYAQRHPNVRVFHFPNAGLSAARNRGVELARAELISFVDGDDFVSPYYLSALYRAYDGVEGRMVQGRGIAGTRQRLRKVEWPNAPIAATELLSGNDLKRTFLLGKLPVSAWARLAHRSLYETVPFTVDMVFEDQMSMPETVEHVSEVAMLDQPVYAYVKREGSISRPNVVTHNLPRDHLRALRHTEAVAGKWDDEARELLSWRLVRLAASVVGLSTALPNRTVSKPYLQEATLVIRQHLPQALVIRRRYRLSWRLIALCILALTSPRLYGMLRKVKHWFATHNPSA